MFKFLLFGRFAFGSAPVIVWWLLVIGKYKNQ